MDLNLFVTATAIILGLVFIILVYSFFRAIKINNKFMAFVLFVLSVATGLGWYALFWNRFFG